MTLYYPMTAILTLFYSVLDRPLDPQSLKDLELSAALPTMVRNIPVRRLSQREVTQIQLIDELVEELTRLGRCAIDKASRENGYRMESRTGFGVV